jgi:hypothetical protein
MNKLGIHVRMLGLPNRVGQLWKFQMSEVDEWGRVGGADQDKMNDSIGHQP